MGRTLFVTTVIPLLLIGCVSVEPEATAPASAPPSFGITTPAPASATPAPTTTPAPTATAVITAPPTATATIAPPTAAPTIPPATEGPTSTPTPTPAAIENFGAGTLLFFDDFSDPTSGWGVGSNEGGSAGYADGTFQFDTSGDEARLWSSRPLDETWNVVRAEGVFVPSGPGFFGFVCAISDDELMGAAVHTDGGWYFFHIDSAGTTNILTSDPGAGWSVPAGAATSLGLDCSGTELGPLRMQISLPEAGVAATFDGGEGPVGFNRVGIYAEANSDAWSLGADDVFAHGGTGEIGMSPAAQALLLHVPEAWRDACFETAQSEFVTGSLAVVSCSVAEVGGKSYVVDYVQFDTQANMDAAYEARVIDWAVEPTASCQSGPNEVSYTIGGTTAGRILCAPQTSGIRFDWTLDSLLILSTLTDVDGSYGDVYADWLIAGPE